MRQSLNSIPIAGNIINNSDTFAGKFADLIDNTMATVEAYKRCLTADMIIAGVDLAVDAVIAVLSFGTGNIIKKLFEGFAKKIAFGIVTNAIIGTLTAVMVPFVAKWK